MEVELAFVRLSVRPSVRLLTISNINISEPSYSSPIEIKFYLKHHWSRVKALYWFGPDRIGILVSMATDNSH